MANVTNVNGVLSRGTQSRVDGTSTSDGMFRFATDSEQLYIDFQDKRIPISDIKTGLTQQEISELETPVDDKLYVASDTHVFMMHHNGEWISPHSETSGNADTLEWHPASYFAPAESIGDGTLTIRKNTVSIGTFSANTHEDADISIQVNNGTLTIKKVGSNSGETILCTFTADQASARTIEVPIPEKTSELENDTFNTSKLVIQVNSTNLQSYEPKDNNTTVCDITVPTKLSDIENDTFQNAKLTIQKNGEDIQTFTVKDNIDKVCNIIVPTKLSDIENDTFNTSKLVIQVNGVDLETFEVKDNSTTTCNIIIPTKLSDLINDLDYHYFGPTAPSDHKLIWFDTSNGYIMKVYDTTRNIWIAPRSAWGGV